ncbi:MAG TPA: ATP synthase subunit I [Rhodocyclaceae bacterium]|nr:ATP synthase subunit I [Rhodocyclaceae bacterium]
MRKNGFIPASGASSRGAHRRQEKHDGAWVQGAKLIKVILLQSGLVATVAAIAAGLVGARGAISALVGGFAYILPNLLFVLRMSFMPGRASVLTFFAGEFFKIAGTIGILVVAVRYYEVHWLCMLVGLLAALKANLFAFLLKT